MNEFNFFDSIKNVPHTYNREDISPLLSFDGQLYVRCSTCKRVLWCNPLYLTSGQLIKEACDNCSRISLKPTRFAHLLVTVCGRCYTEHSFDSRSPSPCRKCGSTSFSVLEVIPNHDMPSTFGTACERKDIDWCVDVADDINFISETLRSFRHGSGFHAICMHYVDFFRSLYSRGGYEANPSLRSELLNAPSQILRQVFRETGDVNIGMRSISLMKEATSKAKDDLTRALYTHNIATNIHSLLCKNLEPVVNAMTEGDIRAEALEYVSQALALYTTCDSLDSSQRDNKCAEVEWLCGDILSAGTAADDEILNASQWYDKALARDGLDDQLRGNIVESRKERVAKMTSPLEGLLVSLETKTEPNLQNDPFSSDPTQRIQDLIKLGISAFEQGQVAESIEHFCEAYGIVRVELATSSRDTVIRNYGSQFMDVALQFARILVANDMREAGIAVIEDIRSFALWEKRTAEEVAKKCAKIGMTASLSKMLGGKGSIPFDETGFTEAMSELADMFQRIFSAADPPDVVLLLNFVLGQVYSLACRLEDGFVVIDALESIGDAELSTLIEPLMALRMANEPSRLRTERVKRIVAKSKRVFEGHSPASFSVASSILIITPFTLVPLEAIDEVPDGKSSGMQAVTYSPSLRIAASMADNWDDRTIAKTLVVGYGGSDLPAANTEVQNIARLFGGKAEVLDGANLSKSEILRRLSCGKYDVVHFACHGTFDATDPLNSALHLSPSEQLSARELLSLDELKGRPLICLSACSSAVVSLNASSNYLGLIGAFFRLGVSGVLGTRWPVKDSIALEFCTRVYDRLAAGISPKWAVQSAQQLVGEHHAIDDANSFIYFGC